MVPHPQERQDHIRRQLIRLKRLAKTDFGKQAVGRDPDARSRLVHGPTRRFQIGSCDRHPPGKRMITRCENHHGALEQNARVCVQRRGCDVGRAERHFHLSLMEHVG